jgi:serine/threonine-protein kinase
MSPEQAEGQTADERSDIWSFGVVLFQMLTGRQPFSGDSVMRILAAVMTSEPDWTTLPAETPSGIRKLLRRLLAKDRNQRLADIRDVRLEIDDAGSASAIDLPPPARRGSAVAWSLVAALAAALLTMFLFWAPWRGTKSADRPPMRLNVDLGPDALANQTFDVAISPDATRLVFPVRAQDGKVLLATRLLSESTQTILGGTEDARSPFFSPDGDWVGFAAGGQIRKVPVRGGAVVPICDAPLVLSATWADDQEITFGPGLFFPLQRVSSNGGKPEAITKTGVQGDATHRFPQALPGGRAVLFTSHKIVTGFDDATIEVVTISTGVRKTLVRGAYAARFVSTPAGRDYLLYVRNGTLFAVPFDVSGLAVRGEAFAVLEDVAGNSDTGAGSFDVSRNGTIIYRAGRGPARTWPVLWLDHTGRTEPVIPTPGTYYTPRLSPDGGRVALTIDRGDKGREIAVYDWHSGAMTQMTFTGEVNLFPIWSPDGRYILFESSSPKGYGIGVVRADGSGELERLGENYGLMIPSSFSPDGKWLVYNTTNAAGTSWLAPFDASDPAHPKLGTPRLFERDGASVDFSPDGRWIAYHSSESGRQEVYVRLAAGGGKVAISTSGGANAIWDGTARRLFFRAADGRLMVVDYVINGDVLSPGAPRVWSDALIGRTPYGRDFSLSRDGSRFVVFPSRDLSTPSGSAHVVFAINVLDELRSPTANSTR